jgi:hypothetical protein
MSKCGDCLIFGTKYCTFSQRPVEPDDAICSDFYDLRWRLKQWKMRQQSENFDSEVEKL